MTIPASSSSSLSMEKFTEAEACPIMLNENVKYDFLRTTVGEWVEEQSCNSGLAGPGHLTSAVNTSSILRPETVKLLRDKVEDRMQNTSIHRAETVKLLKDKIENSVPKMSPDRVSNKLTPLKLISKKQAAWETNFKRTRTMSYQMTMSEDKTSGNEYFVFSPTSSVINESESNPEIEVRVIGDGEHDSCAAEIEISNMLESARLIRNLSDLEQYFLLLGSMEEDKNLDLVVESEVLTKLFEQFEVKHGCRIILVSKLEQKEPCVYCSVETEAAWNRIPVIQKEDHPDAEYYEDIQLIPVKEEEDDPSPPNCALVEESVDNLTKRKHQNPDEIIKGRSKWTEMKFVRKRRLYGEDVEHEDCFDFDRLNPHRTFVQEFEDSLDNTDWAYNHTVLKMMADLNSETLVTLGDSRLKPDLEEKMLKEYEEWEKYKRENKHTYPQVKLKRLKSDKLVKSYKITKIVTKSLRKSPSHCTTPLYS